MKFVILLIITLLISSCTSHKDSLEATDVIKVKKIPESIKMTGIPRNIGKHRFPTEIKIIDEYLFITDLKSEQGMIAIYDTRKNQFLGSYIPKGEGPNELTAISSIFKVNGMIYFLDPQNSRILEAPLDSLKLKGNFMPSHKIKLLRVDDERPLYIQKISDSTLLSQSYPSFKGRFVKLSSGFQQKGDYFSDYPELERKSDVSDMEHNMKVLFSLYYSTFTISDKKKDLIIAYNFVDLIEVYNYETQTKRLTISGPDFNFPPKYILNKNGNAMPCKECKCGYSSPFATTTYLAFLRLHKLYADRDATISRFIYLFNMDGHLQRVLELDSEISQFVIDEKSNKLFAVAVDVDQPLIEYSLAELF